MELLLDLRRVCERYPVLFYAKILCSLCCAVPSVLLLFAALRSSIHSNCRIILCLWTVDQLMVYATVSWLSVHYILYEMEYFTDDFDPVGMVMRRSILSWYGHFWIMCTFLELGISMERGISILNPSKYYKTSAAYFKIIIFSIVSFALAILICELIISGALTLPTTIGALLSNFLDISSFVTNIVVVTFAKKRDQNIHKQLNERYQIRETYLIARAMMPVYFISSSLKVGIIIVNWCYITRTIPFSVCEFVYLVFSEISCGLTSSMFLIHHIRLRSKLNCICKGSSHEYSKRKDTKTATDHYFRALTESWERK